VWHYLLQNQVRVSRRTPEQLDALREVVCRTIDRIRAEETWDARPGKLCAWCEYRSICPAFGGRPAEAPVDVEPEEAEWSQLSLF
jgi:putative RecB family exonuclease